MMAVEHWYILKVRPEFASVVTQKLLKMNMKALRSGEVVAPNHTSINPQGPDPILRESPSTGYVYCRFGLENRHMVTSLPGVLDILGAPEPASVDASIAAFQKEPRSDS
jgi:hypothetical protein